MSVDIIQYIHYCRGYRMLNRTAYSHVCICLIYAYLLVDLKIFRACHTLPFADIRTLIVKTAATGLIVAHSLFECRIHNWQT